MAIECWQKVWLCVQCAETTIPCNCSDEPQELVCRRCQQADCNCERCAWLFGPFVFAELRYRETTPLGDFINSKGTR